MNYYLRLFRSGLKNPKKVYNALKTKWRNIHTDLFIVSYPKTGRTWLRVLIAYVLLGDQKNDKFDEYTHTYLITKSSKCKTTQFTHDGPFNLFNYNSYDSLKFKKEFYKDKKIIFLSRDIRDTLVSHYFEEKKRMKTYDESLSKFLKDDVFGIKKIVNFYNLWYSNKDHLNDFTHIRYEELHHDPIRTLRKVADAMEIEQATDSTIKEAFKFASFKNLQRLEKKNAFHDSKLKPTDKNDEDSYKVRKGKIGGFHNYLSQEDLDYIDSIVKKNGIQNCDWYYWN